VKAKEIAEKIILLEAEDELIIAKEIYAMVMEIETLIQNRNVKSNNSIMAIVKELNKKWIACNKILKLNGINSYRDDSFLLILKEMLPDTYVFFINNDEINKLAQELGVKS
jgi:hypothetical protein